MRMHGAGEAPNCLLQVMSQNSVSLVRVFCFQDGYDLSNSPIQSSPGVWDESGLRRIDLILSQAAQYGIYVIVVPTNFEPVGGGMQWYVDQVSICTISRPMIKGVISGEVAFPQDLL